MDTVLLVPTSDVCKCHCFISSVHAAVPFLEDYDSITDIKTVIFAMLMVLIGRNFVHT